MTDDRRIPLSFHDGAYRLTNPQDPQSGTKAPDTSTVEGQISAMGLIAGAARSKDGGRQRITARSMIAVHLGLVCVPVLIVVAIIEML